MTNPTETGFYWVWATPTGSDRGWMGSGPEVMHFDAVDREWWVVGLDYAYAEPNHATGTVEEMNAWVGPLTPPDLAAVREAVAAERERCARLVEADPNECETCNASGESPDWRSRQLAATIRRTHQTDN